MIRRYIVSETPPWKVQGIFPRRVSETDRALVTLWCSTEQSQSVFLCIFFRGLNHIQVPASPPHSEFTRLLRLAPRTGATLAQLDVLSERVRLMSKPNTSSERLKANIVGRTPSALSVNLSPSEARAKPNTGPRIGTWQSMCIRATDALASRSHTTTTCGAASLFMRRSVNDVPGDAEKQSGALGSPLLLCLPWWFPDASEWSECCGTLGKQPSSVGLEPAGLD